jgi:hypothetical protein
MFFVWAKGEESTGSLFCNLVTQWPMIRAVAFSIVKLGRWEIRQFVRYFEWSKVEEVDHSVSQSPNL